MEDGFMESCWFLCKNIDNLRISPFFDGDLALLKRVYLLIFSFFRKFELSQLDYNEEASSSTFENETNVNGMIVEPVQPSTMMTSKYYIEGDYRKGLFGSDDIRQSDGGLRSSVQKIMTQFGFKQSQIADVFAKPEQTLEKVDKGDGKEIVNYLSTRGSQADLEGKVFNPRNLAFRKTLAKVLIQGGVDKKSVYRKLKLERQTAAKKVKKVIKKLSKKQRKLQK